MVATAGLAAPGGRQDRQVSPPAGTEKDREPALSPGIASLARGGAPEA
jgi:hypothetical protein